MEDNDEERNAAEQYRQDRQQVDADKYGFSAQTRQELYSWMDKNPEIVRGIVTANGVRNEDAPAFVEQYKATLEGTEQGSPLDDLNARMILARAVDGIEQVCKALNIPVRSGVVFGVAPEPGLIASQMPVMQTGTSILSFSLAFVIFCNLISKALARTVIHEAGSVVKASFDPDLIKVKLRSTVKLREEWSSIFVNYAAIQSPPPPTPAPELPAQITRIMVLKAIECFAVAHEYGHHALEHGVSHSSEDISDHFKDEHDADSFARGISIVIGMQEKPENFLAICGAGGVIILGMLDLVRRTRAVLETGSDVYTPRDRHPPYRERIAEFARLDPPGGIGVVSKEMRSNVAAIIEAIWEEVRPFAISLYEEGFRPPSDRPVSEGWLPT
jgi:hypothetical protein